MRPLHMMLRRVAVCCGMLRGAAVCCSLPDISIHLMYALYSEQLVRTVKCVAVLQCVAASCKIECILYQNSIIYRVAK